MQIYRKSCAWYAFSFLFGVCGWLAAPTGAVAAEPITVADALETVRVMPSPESVSSQNPDAAVSISPNATRYVLRTLRGDTARNGVWMELYTGLLSSSKAVTEIKLVTRLFTTGLGSGGFQFLGPDLDASEYYNPVRWLDDDHVAFLWSDAGSIPQVVTIDLPHGTLRWLTQHPTPVGSFDISRSGDVLFNAKARETEALTAQAMTEGFVLPDNVDVFALFRHRVFDGNAMDVRMNTEWFAVRAPDQSAEPLNIAGRPIDSTMLHGIRISRDASAAVVNSAPTSLPSDWSGYTQRQMRSFILEARRDPLAMNSRNVQQLFLLDLKQGTSRPLWSAPCFPVITLAEWSPDDSFLLVAPTFLPVDSGSAEGLSGMAAAVVDTRTGSYSRLPIELEPLGDLAYLRWKGADQVEIGVIAENKVIDRRFARSKGTWQEQTAKAASAHLRIQIDQALEEPPRIVVYDEHARKLRLVLDPNPGLKDKFRWAPAERVQGELDDGTKWQAILFSPPDYDPRKSYPLVIQSVYGPLGSGFTLYGYGGLGPPELSPYPGRLLAQRGMFVLHQTVEVGDRFATPAEAATRLRGFEAAVRQLSATRSIDERRVGLIGFSRNGYYVEYTLSHSTFPFAAAIAADNFEPSYFPITLLVDMVNGSEVNGAAPFGQGLAAWNENAPGFNADRIHTPLRKIEQSFGLFGALVRWEMYSRLRYLQKPVELYLVPDYEHGAHNTQNPRQIAAVQHGTIDWFDFWLNGYEDPAPEKSAQYQRWRRLKQLHEADLAKIPNDRSTDSQ